MVVGCIRAFHRHPNAIVRDVRAANPSMDDDAVIERAFEEIAEGLAAQSLLDAAERDEIDRASRR